MRVVRAIDVPAGRWRNGGGSTRELLAWPSPSHWQVRVSVADIDVDGPFSAYPGVVRWFTVLQGNGIELTIGGAPLRLERGDAPVRFDGAAAAHAHLIDGPTRDLNLMLRDASGSMHCTADGIAWLPHAQQCGLFSAVAGQCNGDGIAAIAMPAYALLWFDAAPVRLTFTAGERPAALIGWWLASTPHGA
jgi:environmental stress-induced protein Ves